VIEKFHVIAQHLADLGFAHVVLEAWMQKEDGQGIL